MEIVLTNLIVIGKAANQDVKILTASEGVTWDAKVNWFVRIFQPCTVQESGPSIGTLYSIQAENLEGRSLGFLDIIFLGYTFDLGGALFIQALSATPSMMSLPPAVRGAPSLL